MEGKRNGKSKMIKIPKDPSKNIYTIVYLFLIETTVKADALVAAEAAMDF